VCVSVTVTVAHPGPQGKLTIVPGTQRA
jgi:hypothetical protein